MGRGHSVHDAAVVALRTRAKEPLVLEGERAVGAPGANRVNAAEDAGADDEAVDVEGAVAALQAALLHLDRLHLSLGEDGPDVFDVTRACDGKILRCWH